MKINPEKLYKAVYNSTREALRRNPMPEGAVCSVGKKKSVVRYQRGIIQSTLGAAIKSAHTAGKSKYVFATHGGFTIWHEKPFNQGYYKVSPDGQVEKFEAY